MYLLVGITDWYILPCFHPTLHQSSYVNFVSNPCSEIYKRFIVVLVFFFFHNLKRHQANFGIGRINEGESEENFVECQTQ